MGPLRLNMLLAASALDPAEVRLLRHETDRHGLTPYALWRDDPMRFVDYQRIQRRRRGAWFRSPYWASFVVAPDGRTLFVGLYAVRLAGAVPSDWIDAISGRTGPTLGTYDLYDLEPLSDLALYAGRLAIDLGPGTRSWVQLASRQDKPIVELARHFIEPDYPGHAAFVSPLSKLHGLPVSWQVALSQTQGVYLLSCPRTREQYVGAATGQSGFLGRWRMYLDGSDGGNVGLRSRDPSDYQVSILQAAGSADDRDAILAMEALWKRKLQSREMGLNRN